MIYRTLGKTGIRVSALAYGASPLGGVFGAVDEAAGIACVHRALDLGINYIDVSPYYGLTKAETVLGKALKTVRRDRFHLATKAGRYGPEAKDFDYSAKRVLASLDGSLRRLNVDYVDVIQCHDIEFVRLDQVVEETIPALRKAKEQGKARFVGITGLPFNALQYVLDRIEVDTVLSYCRYSLNDSSLRHVLPHFRGVGVGVINASPLAMGLLGDREPPDWHPANRTIRETCAKAAAFCRERGADISKLALQFAVANSGIATTIVGTSRAEKIEKNVRCIEEPMDEALLAEVRKILEPIRDHAWHQGLPENHPVCVRCGQRMGDDGYVFTAEGPVALICEADRPAKRSRQGTRRPASALV